MELLTVKEVAKLKGCTKQYVQKIIKNGLLKAEAGQTTNGRPQYFIPLAELEAPLQRKWYKQRGVPLPTSLQDAPKSLPACQSKSLDCYSVQQREVIDQWMQTLDAWQRFRDAYQGSMAQADEAFLLQNRLEVSPKTLYRKQAAYRRQDWDGLIDRRGLCNKGRTSIPADIRKLFEYFYLDERGLNIQACYHSTEITLKERAPELLQLLPSYATMRRWARELPAPVATLVREGDKAFNDKYGIFVDRLYDDMLSNDYWIADGHRIDVITKSEDGREQQHRLTLSAFIDARSGIYVGWVITDNPSSDATLLALRKAISRYGIPRYLYVDNGREYLNYDIGGMGHRARTRKAVIKLPTPILSRLGITMTNALPRNAQTKTIEREFRNFTFLSQLFETYCGSNVVVKPEKLKAKLKCGRIPTDSELYEVVESMIDGYFNCQPYGGKVSEDCGKPKIEVYYDNRPETRVADESDLSLMMMRSSRMQTIGRNGVYVIVSGEKIYYFDDELLMMQGKKVFVRYDPETMEEVRVYDEDEVFMKTAPLRRDIMETYFANKEGLREAMAVKRRWRKRAKEEADAIRERVVAQYGHINILDLYVRAANANREGLLVTDCSKVLRIVRPEETMARIAATGTDGTVTIDKGRMIKNNEG